MKESFICQPPFALKVTVSRTAEEGEYVPLPADENGIIRSQIIPGLWLAVEDLLARNMLQVLAVVQEGLASPEQAIFRQKLLEEI